MNIFFLCHTPLHVLIAALESQKLTGEKVTYFIVEDTPEIHSLAEAMLGSKEATFSMLPGTAFVSSGADATRLQKQNAENIKEAIDRIPPDRICIFFDQRAEAQALLNHKYKSTPNVVLLEDGISTYKVASPFPRPFRRLIKHKLRFDLSWKGSAWIGSHPSIDEVHCFFPEFLRPDMRVLKTAPLLRRLTQRYIENFSQIYGKRKYEEPIGAITVPHPDSVTDSESVEDFVRLSIAHCESARIKPVLKLHPRDNRSKNHLLDAGISIQTLDKNLPLELILFTEKSIKLVFGYRTSALHVIHALHRETSTLYYEPTCGPSSAKWHEFYEQLSIRRLAENPTGFVKT